jgi:hypothetical protein
MIKPSHKLVGELIGVLVSFPGEVEVEHSSFEACMAEEGLDGP